MVGQLEAAAPYAKDVTCRCRSFECPRYRAGLSFSDTTPLRSGARKPQSAIGTAAGPANLRREPMALRYGTIPGSVGAGQAAALKQLWQLWVSQSCHAC